MRGQRRSSRRRSMRRRFGPRTWRSKPPARSGPRAIAEVTSYLPPLPGYRGALAAHVEMIRRAAESVSVPLIASLNGVTREGWTGIAADLEESGRGGARAQSLPHPHRPAGDLRRGRGQTGRNRAQSVQAVTIPVAVKLSPNFTAPAHLASALADAGAKGIVLFNRWYEPDIDLETLTFHPVLRLSTAEEIRLPLMWVALLAGKTSLSLAGGRGVEGPEEVIKYLLAGADVVLAASSLLRHGPKHLSHLVDGLADWIEAHGASSVGRDPWAPARRAACPSRNIASRAVRSHAGAGFSRPAARRFA